MIEEAERKGQIKPGYTLIEPTSGINLKLILIEHFYESNIKFV